MTTPDDRQSDNDADALADRELRSIASGLPPTPLAGALSGRVLGRVHRRRTIQRGLTGVVALAAVAALFFIARPTDQTSVQTVRTDLPNTSQWAQLDTRFLTAAPPVDNLAVIDRDQSALLEVLVALGSEAP